ncbi:MAG TPA: hypothetical protein VG674_05300 [Amycolatopsis sp.]|nr:hypothetical protein [Amycolatopsis sp.]
MSAFRIEARRTIAPWLVVILLAVGLGFFYLFTGPWWRDADAWNLQWTPSVLWSRYLLSLLWPVIVCASAIQGMRDHRSGMDELISTTPRPALQRVAQASLAVGLSAVVAYLVIVAIGLGQVIANDGRFTFAWVLPLLAGVASVVAGVAVGLAAGRLLPHPLTAPAAGVVALLVGVVLSFAGARGSSLGSMPNWVALLTPAGGEPRSAFVDPVPAVSVGQLCWLLGLAATGFLVLATRRWFAVVPVVAGLAVAIPIFPASASGNFADNTGAAAPVCDGPVCVTTLHEHWLSTVAGPGKAALAALAKLSAAPTRIEETTEPMYEVHDTPNPNVLAIRRDGYNLRDATGRTLEYEILATAPLCSGAETASAARYVIASWLLGGDLIPPPHSDVYGSSLAPAMRSAWMRLHAVPPAEQLARVSAAHHAQQTCSGDPYALLVGAAR